MSMPEQASIENRRAAASPTGLRGWPQGRRATASGLLAPVYAWFSEGFETADLKARRPCSTSSVDFCSLAKACRPASPANTAASVINRRGHQDPETQLLALRHVAERAGRQIEGEYVDHGISGAKGRDQRPEFDRLLKDATRRHFDVVMAWSVDRLGRSLQDLVAFVGDHGFSQHSRGRPVVEPPGQAAEKVAPVFRDLAVGEGT
jgi:hypothetical protein